MKNLNTITSLNFRLVKSYVVSLSISLSTFLFTVFNFIAAACGALGLFQPPVNLYYNRIREYELSLCKRINANILSGGGIKNNLLSVY